MSEEQMSVAEHATLPAQLSVKPTGISGLDEVLGGGLADRSLAIIVGPPGSGKTMIANQIAFAAAHAGRRALVFTALSEPTNKLVSHLRTFTFFDQALTGDAIQFFSLQQFLQDGLAAAAEHVVTIARQSRANLVVIDGFRGIRGSDANAQASREFLYDVGTQLSILGMTTLITSEADPRDPQFFPEATTADVIIGLHYGLSGVRERRALEAVKVRGGRLLPGLHGLRLTDRGATVYPRIEARVARQEYAGEPEEGPVDEPAETASQDERLPFGLPTLDHLLGGGLPRETATLLIGSPGTGKTLFALRFALEGVRAGEPTVFLGLRESRRRLLHLADAFVMGRELRQALLPDGGLTLQRWAPIEMNPDIIADRLLHTLERTGARRVVIDGMDELEHAIARSGDARRTTDYLAALVEALQLRHATSLFVAEYPKVVSLRIDFGTDAVSVLAENMLFLQQVYYRAQLHRVLSVVKMRFAMHDFMVHEYTVEPPEGIRVLDPFESNEEMLSGIASEVASATTIGRSQVPRGTGAAMGVASLDPKPTEETL